LVVSKYLAAMARKDSKYLSLTGAEPIRPGGSFEAPEIAEGIPNVDHRFGDGRAEVLGIEVLDDPTLTRAALLRPNSTIVVRISVRARETIARPIVGFMLRNHLGIDFAGTNTAREKCDLAPMGAGDIYTVDFHLEVPELYASTFSFSPAVADGKLDHYEICDWIDNAVALQMSKSASPIYGTMHLKCRVEVNQKLAPLETAVVRSE